VTTTGISQLWFSGHFRQVFLNTIALQILFRNGNLTLVLAGWWRRLWARSGCGGSGWAPGWCGWDVSSLLKHCCGGGDCWRPAISLPTQSVAVGETVSGCRLVACSVVSGRPLLSRAVAGVLMHVCVCLGPVLASHATSLPAAAAAAWRGRGRVHIAGWSYRGVGPVRGLRGGGRREGCEEWARRG
jgi:hypothetical protein